MSKKTNPPSSGNPVGKVVFLIFVALLVATGGLYVFTRSGDTAQAPAETASTNHAAGPGIPGSATVSEEASPKANKAFEILLGRWLREDGGYVIEISEIMPGGTLKAAYFNPNRIHVSRAAAAEQSGSIQVGIELNDVNYPGCLYTLVFNPALDQLQGQYFQAGSGQTYNVAFVRMTEQ
jgi:hypothetical protein